MFVSVTVTETVHIKRNQDRNEGSKSIFRMLWYPESYSIVYKKKFRLMNMMFQERFSFVSYTLCSTVVEGSLEPQNDITISQ